MSSKRGRRTRDDAPDGSAARQGRGGMSEPGDVPAERPASLDRLDALLGTWELEASFDAGFFGPDSPAFTERGGTTTFEWLEGRFFLLQRFTVFSPGAPSGIAIIGVADDSGEFEQHYYDSR